MKTAFLTSPSLLSLRLFAFCLAVLTSFAFGCSSREETSGEELIAGSSSKTWITDQELRADGNKVLDTQHQQTFQFFADGKFSKSTSDGVDEGTWSYDPSRRSLTLTYGSDPAFSLQLLTLRQNRMRLQVPDGSIMNLKVQ